MFCDPRLFFGFPSGWAQENQASLGFGCSINTKLGVPRSPGKWHPGNHRRFGSVSSGGLGEGQQRRQGSSNRTSIDFPVWVHGLAVETNVALLEYRASCDFSGL